MRACSLRAGVFVATTNSRRARARVGRRWRPGRLQAHACGSRRLQHHQRATSSLGADEKAARVLLDAAATSEKQMRGRPCMARLTSGAASCNSMRTLPASHASFPAQQEHVLSNSPVSPSTKDVSDAGPSGFIAHIYLPLSCIIDIAITL